MPADERPSPKQQRYLHSLAQRTGTSFTPPATRAQASRETQRLKELARSPRQEREQDRVVNDGLATRTSDARLLEHEVKGWGSSTRWR